MYAHKEFHTFAHRHTHTHSYLNAGPCNWQFNPKIGRNERTLHFTQTLYDDPVCEVFGLFGGDGGVCAFRVAGGGWQQGLRAVVVEYPRGPRNADECERDPYVYITNCTCSFFWCCVRSRAQLRAAEGAQALVYLQAPRYVRCVGGGVRTHTYVGKCTHRRFYENGGRRVCL